MHIGPVEAQRTIIGRQKALMRWYRVHGRHHLPWRHTRDPYGILVSEVMLQQTQVDRVIPYWIVWMRRWPTIETLARARRASVIRAWAGLGYNRRAVYLHQLAQEHASKFNEVSQDYAERSVAKTTYGRMSNLQRVPNIHQTNTRGGDLRRLAARLGRLPGVGPYTANALLAFAWNLPAPCVDTNVRRVLAHAIYRRPAIMRMPLRQVTELAARVIPKGRGRDWNYALMDYGALILTARAIRKCAKLGFEHFGHGRKVERFVGSSRFWRGRIVAVLRAARRPMPITVLRRSLATYGEIPGALDPLLTALVRDGVVRHADAGYRLA